MMTIDKLESVVEKLSEKIRNLSFDFLNDALESDANGAKESAIAALEDFLEMASEDWEQREESEDDDDEKDA